MENTASNIRKVTVSSDQHYEWGTVENRFSKIKKYACIDYYFYGPQWEKLAVAFKKAHLKSMAILYYKGAIIDEANKIVKLRGHFIRDVVSDKYFSFWSYYFNCHKDNPPKFVVIGDIVKLPNIAGDNDSVNVFINGKNVQEILFDPEEEAA